MLAGEVCNEHSGICGNYTALNDKVDKNDSENRDSHKEMWKKIDRLPTWATLFISFLTLCLGLSVGALLK